jgi:hypothetical protein
MKRLFTLVAIALLVFACAGHKEQALSLYGGHCTEHATDMYDNAEDVDQQRFNECLDLHVKGIVLSDSSDEHLSGLH